MSTRLQPLATFSGTFVVAQLGARMAYAVPRILYDVGRLERLFTDACASKAPLNAFHLWPPAWRPGAVRRMLDRKPKDLPRGFIRANQLLGLRYSRDYAKTKTESDRNKLFLRVGEEFGQWVARKDWGLAKNVFVYNSAGERILEECKRRGLRGVVEQTIAPYAVERRLLAVERERFPRWEIDDAGGWEFDEVAARERREWRLADLVVCGSEFVREGITAEGGDAARTVVVPYGVDSSFQAPSLEPHDGRLRVLTVGAVGLRKGTMYAVEAARRLRDKADFRWVGPFKMNPDAKADMGEDVEFTGPVPRSEVRRHFAWADVFLLPSLCEGSATSTYEALTAGRPVICTPNCGSVVRDGIEGFIVPIRDVDAIVDRLERLANDRHLRTAMAAAAVMRAGEMNYNAYARNLLAALSRQV